MINNKMDKATEESIVSRHPCFSVDAHRTYSRVHMPVAPKCNIQCRYCIRKFDCANETRPGVTSRVLSPQQAIDRIELLAERSKSLSVVGIAGPGDPLANDETFEFLAAMKRFVPHLIACVSTNGLALGARLNDLISAGVSSLTVTVNSITPETADKIYAWINEDGKHRQGRWAMERLLDNQWSAIAKAVKAGLIVKINTIYIPGINEHEIPVIARRVGNIGVKTMNLMPLIPQAEFAELRMPGCGELDRLRAVCEAHVPQMRHCKQCRADAFGLLGEDKDMDLEMLNARIGLEYCESVL